MQSYEQLKTYRVAGRENGELQGFHVEAKSLQEAFQIVGREAPKVKPVLILVQ
jgi:hypothetical protein